MAVRLVAVTFDCPRPGATGEFWARLLGRELVEEPDGVLVPGDPTHVGLRFVRSDAERPHSNRLHLHVTSDDLDEQRRIVETVLRLGGRRRGTRPLPLGRDLYLTDPSGDEFCVIEPGNGYLAGCGPLGEVTCDGSPATGRFWSAALEWPIVWDQGEQIAIQSPQGGTKIAWDRWPEPPSQGRDRQRFDLAAADPASEVDRLVALGATAIGRRDGVVILADLDGSPFSVGLKHARRTGT